MEGEIEGGERPREGEKEVRENDRNFQIMRIIRVKVGEWTNRQQREDICKQDCRKVPTTEHHTQECQQSQLRETPGDSIQGP